MRNIKYITNHEVIKWKLQDFLNIWRDIFYAAGHKHILYHSLLLNWCFSFSHNMGCINSLEGSGKNQPHVQKKRQQKPHFPHASPFEARVFTPLKKEPLSTAISLQGSYHRLRLRCWESLTSKEVLTNTSGGFFQWRRGQLGCQCYTHGIWPICMYLYLENLRILRVFVDSFSKGEKTSISGLYAPKS